MSRDTASGHGPNSQTSHVGSTRSDSGLAFTRRQRLLKGSEFNRVFAKPRRSTDRYFAVLVRENNHAHARLGLAVAKKRIRLAVGRNRIKRLVRESFRQHADMLGTVDVIVLSRFDGKADNGSVLRSLDSHWKRLGKVRNQCPAKIDSY